MTNEELELQELEAELAALEETEKVEEPVLELVKPKRKAKVTKKEEPKVVPQPEPEPPAPAAPTPPAPVAAPMPEPVVSYAPPAPRKVKLVRPTKQGGDSNRGIRKRNF
jgi:hypothetical protein